MASACTCRLRLSHAAIPLHPRSFRALLKLHNTLRKKKPSANSSSSSSSLAPYFVIWAEELQHMRRSRRTFRTLERLSASHLSCDVQCCDYWSFTDYTIKSGLWTCWASKLAHFKCGHSRTFREGISEAEASTLADSFGVLTLCCHPASHSPTPFDDHEDRCSAQRLRPLVT